MLSPLVSVIVPNYNHAPFLKQRIDSILQQTYTSIEVIILDDCSTDNSLEIINTYKNNNKVTHIIPNTKNSGHVFTQWLRGLQEAKGSYIWIAESDDYASPFFLSTLMALGNTYPKANVLYCASHVVDEKNLPRQSFGDTIIPNQYDGAIFLSDFFMDGPSFASSYLFKRNYFYNTSAMLFKKEGLAQAITTGLSYKINGDWKIWFSLLAKGGVAYSYQPLNYFRSHRQSVRVSLHKSNLCFEEYLAIMSDFKKEFTIDNKTASLLLHRIVFDYTKEYSTWYKMKRHLWLIHQLAEMGYKNQALLVIKSQCKKYLSIA